MAYVFDPSLSDEENRRRASEGEARPATSEIAGGGQAAGAQPPGTPTASGSFTSLQRYLSENQPQAANLAGKVAGQVTTAGEEARTAAEGVAQAGSQAIEAGRVPYQAEVIEDAVSNPAGITGDAAKKAAFLKQRDASYAGPAGLEDVEGFQSAQDKVKKAQENIALAGNESGRTQLLTNLSPAGAGKGKLALNNLLLSGNEEASGILAGAGEPYKNLGDYLTAQSAEARQKAVDATTEAAGTRQRVQDRFSGEGGVVPSMAADLTARLGSAKTVAQQRADAARADLQSMNLSDQDLADLGLTREQFNNIKGYQDITLGHASIDPLAYLTTRNADAEYNIGNVATAEDYARQAALEDLLGGQVLTGINPADAARAGTAPKDITDYDVGGAQGAARSSFNTFMSENPPMLAQNGLAVGEAPSLGDLARGDFYTALNTLGRIKAVLDMTIASPAQKQAAQRFTETPIFQQLYAAAQQARAQQAPGSDPDPLINHVSPEVAAMLR